MRVEVPNGGTQVFDRDGQPRGRPIMVQLPNSGTPHVVREMRQQLHDERTGQVTERVYYVVFVADARPATSSRHGSGEAGDWVLLPTTQWPHPPTANGRHVPRPTTRDQSPSTGRLPEPTTRGEPQPTPRVAPHSTTRAVPLPTTLGQPHPTARVAPHPTTRAVPHPTTRVVPSPTTRVAPHPTTQAVPHPTTRVAPSPTTQVPQPSTRVPPAPTPAAATSRPNTHSQQSTHTPRMSGTRPDSKNVDFDFRPSPGEPRNRPPAQQTAASKPSRGSTLAAQKAWDRGNRPPATSDRQVVNRRKIPPPTGQGSRAPRGILRKTQAPGAARVEGASAHAQSARAPTATTSSRPPTATGGEQSGQEKKDRPPRGILKTTEGPAPTGPTAPAAPSTHGERSRRAREDFSERDERVESAREGCLVQ
jgi:hypothetical protein